MIRSNSGAEGAGCSCSSELEHAKMVAGVQASFALDPARALLRQERSATALRRAVLAQTNGRSSSSP